MKLIFDIHTCMHTYVNTHVHPYLYQPLYACVCEHTNTHVI